MTNPIQISINDKWRGKTALSEPPDHTTFTPRSCTLELFTTWLRKGYRWSGAQFQGNYRNEENVVQVGAIAFDLDTTAPEDVKSELATLVYPSPSNGQPNGSGQPKQRCRMVFVLEEPVQDAEYVRKAIAAGIHHHQPLGVATECLTPSQGWYGAGQGEWQVYPDRRLSRAVMDAWIKKHDEYIAAELGKTKADAPVAPPLTGQPMEKYALKAFEGVLSDLRSTTGGERNVTLFKATCRALGFVRGGWPGMAEGQVLADLRSTARVLGLPESEIESTIKSATKAAKPATLPLDTSVAPVRLAEFDAPPMPLPPVLNIQVVTGEEASMRAAKTFEERLLNPQAILGMRSDITCLDYALGGFAPGGCYTFLGETGTGKTTLCASLAYKFAGQGRGIIVSAENSAEAFIDKMVAYATELSYGDIRRGGKLVWEAVGGIGDQRPKQLDFTPAEKNLLARARERIHQYIKGTVFVPHGSPSPAILRSVFQDYGKLAQWAILDSLNNIRISGAGEYENMTDAALLAEELAVDYNIPVIATAQGGRNTKDRRNKELTLHDAVGSNHVENKGHAVITLYNQWKLLDDGVITENDTDPAYPRGQVKLRVVKLRDGNPGKPMAVRYVGGSGFYSVK